MSEEFIYHVDGTCVPLVPGLSEQERRDHTATLRTLVNVNKCTVDEAIAIVALRLSVKELDRDLALAKYQTVYALSPHISKTELLLAARRTKLDELEQTHGVGRYNAFN